MTASDAPPVSHPGADGTPPAPGTGAPPVTPVAVVQVEGLTVRRGARRVLDDVGFRVLTGDHLVVVGDDAALNALRAELTGTTRRRPLGRRTRRRHTVAIPSPHDPAVPARQIVVGGGLATACAAFGIEWALTACAPADLAPAWADAVGVAIGAAQAAAAAPTAAIVIDRPERFDPWLRAALGRWCADRLRHHAVVVLTGDPAIARSAGSHGADATHIVLLAGGRVVEAGPADDMLRRAAAPATRIWLAADTGTVPAAEFPSGCPLATCCPSATPVCFDTPPPRRLVAADHVAACHLGEDVASVGTRLDPWGERIEAEP